MVDSSLGRPQSSTLLILSPALNRCSYCSRVSVVDPSIGSVVTKLPAANVYELGFSPLGNYIITWQRPSKDENGDATKNLKVWRTVDAAAQDDTEGTIVGQFVQKSQTGWNLQYTPDERYCARVVTNEVQFYESSNLNVVWNKLRVEGVSEFAISPGEDHSVAVFVPERKVGLLWRGLQVATDNQTRARPRLSKSSRFPHSRKQCHRRRFTKQTKCNSSGTQLVQA